jgi:trans-aconitate 3-methyltransferase
MARYFKRVIGVDPSPGMIAQARSLTPKKEYLNVEFQEGNAEDLPFLPEEGVDMVVAGQAAHWFNFSKLFPELSRIVRQNGTLAFWGYAGHAFVDHPKATAIMHKYCYDESKNFLGPLWDQPSRSIVEAHLRPIEPPKADWRDIKRVMYEPDSKNTNSDTAARFVYRRMKLGEVMQYIRTFSAFHSWKEAHPDIVNKSDGGPGDIVDTILEEIIEEEPGVGSDDAEIEVEWASGLLMARKK